MKTLLRILMLTVLFCINNLAIGQSNEIQVDTNNIYKVELRDGSVFYGNIFYQDSVKIELRTTSIPKLDIPLSKILKLDELDKSNFRNGKYWFNNPHATRYLHGPSAFNLKKGEGYYKNTMLIMNSFNYGITDNISIGGGIELISTFGSILTESFNPIFFITPKVSYKVANNIHAGAGVIYVNVPGFLEDRTGMGIAYGIGTYGTEEYNMTAGVGYGFIQGTLANNPVLTLSGMARISRRTALVTESWFIPMDGYNGMHTYGIRFLAEKTAIDLAFINNPDIASAIIIGIPYVSFSVKI
jgi:hypothetical protein